MAKYKKGTSKRKLAGGGMTDQQYSNMVDSDLSYNGNPVTDKTKSSPNYGQIANYGVAAGQGALSIANTYGNPNSTDAQKGDSLYQGAKGVASAVPVLGPIVGAVDAVSSVVDSGFSVDKTNSKGELVNSGSSDVGRGINNFLNPAKTLANTMTDSNASDTQKVLAAATGGISDIFFTGDHNRNVEKVAKEQIAAQQTADQQAQQAQQDYINQQVQAGLATQQAAYGGFIGQHAMGGNLTQYQGNTHEQGGIPLGQNDEVETGETRGPKEIESVKDYIYSDRLKVPGKSYTFAKASKMIESKLSKRTNDKMTTEMKEKMLTDLMNLNEQSRMSIMDRAHKKAYGGPIGDPIQMYNDSVTINKASMNQLAKLKGTQGKYYLPAGEEESVRGFENRNSPEALAYERLRKANAEKGLYMEPEMKIPFKTGITNFNSSENNIKNTLNANSDTQKDVIRIYKAPTNKPVQSIPNRPNTNMQTISPINSLNQVDNRTIAEPIKQNTYRTNSFAQYVDKANGQREFLTPEDYRREQENIVNNLQNPLKNDAKTTYTPVPKFGYGGKLKHWDGSELMMNQNYVQQHNPLLSFEEQARLDTERNRNFASTNGSTNFQGNPQGTPLQQSQTFDFGKGQNYLGNQANSGISSTPEKPYVAPQEKQPTSFDPNTLYNVGNFVGSSYDVWRGLKGGDPVNYERVNPDLVDYSASREMNNRDIKQGFRGTQQIAKNLNNSAQYMSYVGDAAAKRDKAISDSNAKSYENEKNTNAQLKNQSKYFNAQTQQAEANARQQEKDIASNTLSTGLYNAGMGLSQMGSDANFTKQDRIAMDAIGSKYPDWKYDKKTNTWKHKSGEVRTTKELIG